MPGGRGARHRHRREDVPYVYCEAHDDEQVEPRARSEGEAGAQAGAEGTEEARRCRSERTRHSAGRRRGGTRGYAAGLASRFYARPRPRLVPPVGYERGSVPRPPRAASANRPAAWARDLASQEGDGRSPHVLAKLPTLFSATARISTGPFAFFENFLVRFDEA